MLCADRKGNRLQASSGTATSTTQHSRIEKILGVRVKLGVRQYKVKWKEYISVEHTL